MAGGKTPCHHVFSRASRECSGVLGCSILEVEMRTHHFQSSHERENMKDRKRSTNTFWKRGSWCTRPRSELRALPVHAMKSVGRGSGRRSAGGKCVEELQVCAGPNPSAAASPGGGERRGIRGRVCAEHFWERSAGRCIPSIQDHPWTGQAAKQKQRSSRGVWKLCSEAHRLQGNAVTK